MKVSVIIPVYNVYDYLDKCLDSLVHQTLKDIEIIVVNDGSPDDSDKIIAKYQKRYPRKIVSLTKKNGGQGSARNLGLTKAQGKYVAFVDSDDYIEKDMLEAMYNKASKTNSDIVICSTNVVSLNYDVLKCEHTLMYHDKTMDTILGKMAVWDKLYKKELFDDIKFREKVWYEDIDVTFKLLTKASKISFIDKPFYNYLLRPGSTMNNINLNKNLELLTAFDEMISYLKKNDMYTKYYEKLELLAIYHIYISGITRLIKTKTSMRDKKIIINKYIDYMNTNFKGFNSNRYINKMEKNKKIVYKLISLKQYHLLSLLFKVKEKI